MGYNEEAARDWTARGANFIFADNEPAYGMKGCRHTLKICAAFWRNDGNKIMITVRNKKMLLIEAHAHVWDLMHGRRLDTKTHEPDTLGRTRTGDDIAQFMPPEWRDVRSPIEVYQAYMQLLGIDKAVLLQNPCYGQQYDYVNAILAANPGTFATVGVPNPQDKTSYLETARLCLGQFKYKGLKFECPDIPFDMVDPENAFVFETIQRYGAYCMIDMGWGTGPYDYPIHDMQIVTKRYPDLAFIFPHLGVSRLWDVEEHNTGYPSLHKTLDMLEYNENIWFDLAGVTALLSRFEDYPYPSVAKILQVIKKYNALGRIMWGTDYPSVLKTCTYQQNLTYITRYCDFLTDDDMENILGRTAEKVWFS